MKTLKRILSNAKAATVLLMFVGISCDNPGQNDSLKTSQTDSVQTYNPTLPIDQNPIERAATIETKYFTPENNYNNAPIWVNLDLEASKVKIAIPYLSTNDSIKVFQGDFENKKVIDIQVDPSLEGTPWSSTCYVEVDIEDAENCQGVLVRLFSKTDSIKLVAQKEVEAESVFNPTNPELNNTVEDFEHTILKVEPHFKNMFVNDSVLFIQYFDTLADSVEITAMFFDASSVGDFQIRYDVVDNYLIFHIDANEGLVNNPDTVCHQIEFKIPKNPLKANEKTKGKYKNSRRNCKTITIHTYKED